MSFTDDTYYPPMPKKGGEALPEVVARTSKQREAIQADADELDRINAAARLRMGMEPLTKPSHANGAGMVARVHPDGKRVRSNKPKATHAEAVALQARIFGQAQPRGYVRALIRSARCSSTIVYKLKHGDFGWLTRDVAKALKKALDAGIEIGPQGGPKPKEKGLRA